MNGTGPMGEGAMTGRRMGRCANTGAGMQNNETVQNVPSVENEVKPEQQPAGFGMGRGLGRGRGQKGKGMGMGRQNRGQGRGNRSNG